MRIVSNRFFLDTSVYRETFQLLYGRMRVSRQTVTNGLENGSGFFREVMEYLKKFFSEAVAGNRDEGKLMLSTIQHKC